MVSTKTSASVREVNEQFRDETTIDGIKKLRVVGHGCHQWQQMSYFLVVLLGSTAIGVYQTCLTVNDYLQFAVETDLSYLQASSANPLEFPAITFCSNNQFFRDSFGTNPYLYLPVISIMQPQIPFAEGVQMCHSSAPAPNQDIVNALSINDLIPEFTGAGINKRWNHNSFNSVLGCRWQGRLFSCADVFINHGTDTGECFTFNAAPVALDAYWLSPPDIFGTNATTMSAYNFMASMPGKASGVEFVLYARSAQYCSSGVQLTFGFSALVHERDVAPAMSQMASIELTPGFDVSVAISVEMFHRETEALGYCQSSWAPTLYPPGSRYTYDSCRIEAVSLAVVAQCGCMSQITPPFGQVKVFAQGIGYCLNQSSNDCSTRVQNDPRMGDECIVQCDETNYVVRAAAAYFPAPSALEQFIREFNLSDASSAEIARGMSLDDVRKDYLRVTFFLETLQYKFVVEQQAMSVFDLFNNIGGAIGLSVGISVLSLPETLFWLCRLAAAMIRKGWRLNHSAKRVVPSA